MILRIPDSYDAKIAKICNFWTFWPVITGILKHGKFLVSYFCGVSPGSVGKNNTTEMWDNFLHSGLLYLAPHL